MVEKNTLDSELEDFLKLTRSCDFNNPFVKNKVLEIVQGIDNDLEKALKIFLWIRDEIKFGVSSTDARASSTLKRGFGDCGNKASLQIAFLRCVGIPARMDISIIKTELLQPVIPAFLYNRHPPKLGHAMTECFIEDKWIKCDPLYDKPLYDKLLERKAISKEQIPTIDWDGKTDLILLKHWLIEEKGWINTYDDFFKSRPLIEKLIGWYVYKKGIQHTDKIRNSE